MLQCYKLWFEIVFDWLLASKNMPNRTFVVYVSKKKTEGEGGGAQKDKHNISQGHQIQHWKIEKRGQNGVYLGLISST